MSPVQWVAEQKTWERIAERLAQQPELALDTESNSLYAYRERICLIQIATSDETFLLDPLAVKDLSSLGYLLSAPTIAKILHGCDYDLRCLDRDYGYRMTPVFDTGVAARFLGVSSPNLASVLETFLGVSITKSRKLQRSNWGVRPLNSLAMEYAASDVRYLTRLADTLRWRLAQANRLEWLKEECWRLEQVRYSPPDSEEDAFLRIKGSDQLKPTELAVLKELVAFRDTEARRLDWPPFRVIGNEALLFLAQRPNVPLDRVPGLSPWLLNRVGSQIQAAIDRGRHSPGLRRPKMPKTANIWPPEARALLHRLKRWRTELGERLDLDPALLWPSASLERLALQPDEWQKELGVISPSVPKGGTKGFSWPVQDTEGPSEVRDWQRREFSQELKKALDESQQATG